MEAGVEVGGMDGSIPRVGVSVEQDDVFPLIESKLHRPPGTSCDGFSVVVQLSEGEEGVGFSGQVVIALQEGESVKVSGNTSTQLVSSGPYGVSGLYQLFDRNGGSELGTRMIGRNHDVDLHAVVLGRVLGEGVCAVFPPRVQDVAMTDGQLHVFFGSQDVGSHCYLSALVLRMKKPVEQASNLWTRRSNQKNRWPYKGKAWGGKEPMKKKGD